MGGYYGRYSESAANLSRFIEEAKIPVQDKTKIGANMANTFSSRYNLSYSDFKK